MVQESMGCLTSAMRKTHLKVRWRARLIVWEAEPNRSHWSGNRFVIWNVNSVDDAGWKAAAGRQGYLQKSNLCAELFHFRC